jgi:hypothetical protein
MLTGLGGYEATIYSSQAKIVAAFTMIIALAIFAVPAGIIAASYEEFFENMLEQQQRKKEKEEKQRILDEEEAERDRKRVLRSAESGEVDYEALPIDDHEDDEGQIEVEAIGEEQKQKKPKSGKKKDDKVRYSEETDDEEELEDDTDSDEDSEEDSEEGTESDSSDGEEEGIDKVLFDFSKAVLSNPDLRTCRCPNCGDTVKFRNDQ